MNRGRPVPVVDRAGRVLGHVSASATSIGAAKLAGRPCEFARDPALGYVWRASADERSSKSVDTR
jgi:hypothetical protein